MKVAVLGYGVVGRGVCKMIADNAQFDLAYVLVRPGKCSESFMVDDISVITNDPSVETVVECMGGVDAAFEYARKSLENNKNVVTSNKALVVAKGLELQKLAQNHQVSFLFSAACGGAIPVLHNLAIARKTDLISNVQGILNGTTNFILTKMKEDLMDYLSALKLAQQLGYAEADPTADVSGMDTMRKIILASAIAFDRMPVKGYLVEGIENVVSQLPAGYDLKLVGSCGLNKDSSIYSFVQPTLVPSGSVLASVRSNFNMARYEGSNCGKMTLIGQGAGSLPTASAVMRDLSELDGKQRYMFGPSCKEVQCDNSKKKYRYYIVEENNTSTEYMDVVSMFDRAKEAEKHSKKFFFAAFEE